LSTKTVLPNNRKLTCGSLKVVEGSGGGTTQPFPRDKGVEELYGDLAVEYPLRCGPETKDENVEPKMAGQ